MRRLFSGCLQLLFLIIFVNVAVAESQEEWTARLVEGAKKEGRLRWTTGMNQPETAKFIKRFNEKYPFIKIEANRGTGQTFITKTLAEAKAGVHNYDVFQTSFTLFTLLKEHKLVAKYISPESKHFPKALVDPEGYWTDHTSSYFVTGFNTRLVAPQDAPKRLTDLLDPKWKSKMGMDDKAFEWFAGVLRMMGEENGLKYFEKLSKQDILFRKGKSLLARMMVAGEVSIAITQYESEIEQLKAQGAPVEWVAFDQVVTILHPVYISAHARYPNAAKLFVDFLLSQDGQAMLVDLYRTPSRIGIKRRGSGLKDDTKLLPYDASYLSDYNRTVKLFRQILLKAR